MRTIKIFVILSILIAVSFMYPSKPSVSLKDIVDNSLIGSKGIYAIAVKNMKTKEEYLLSGKRSFDPGSLYKLWVMAVVFDQISKGELKEDQVLSQEAEVLNREFEIDEENAEIKEGTITMTVVGALEQMISISHNYAALLLTEKVGVSRVEKYLENNGFANSHVGDNRTTTAKDILLFYEKLYKGELVSREYSQKMIGILKKQKLNDGLPKMLPQNLKIAHKTGDIGWFKHDAGIVFDKGDYIVVAMSESNSPAGAQKRIALLSKSIFDYFPEQKNEK